MIEYDEVTDLVRARAKIFTAVCSRGVKSGLDVKSTSTLCIRGMEVLVQRPVFILGQLSDYYPLADGKAILDNEFVLPFDSFGISTKTPNTTLLITVARTEYQGTGEGLTLVSFLLNENGWQPHSNVFLRLVPDTDNPAAPWFLESLTLGVGPVVVRREAFLASQDEITSAFLSAMAKINMTSGEVRVKEATPKATLHTVAKARQPLWTYRVQALTPSTRGAAGSGTGCGTKKRFHERRGFIRTLSSGKQVAVRSTTVGDISLGAVYGDYAAKGEA